MNFKKVMGISLASTLAIGAMAGCGASSDKTTKGNETVKEGNENKEKGKVYYLSFKPEQADIWKEIAAKYTDKTGVEVKVVTAASGQYEQTLKSEIAKKDAPTLFQINGPVGYNAWKDYCEDLKDTNLYSWLKDKDMAVKDGDGVFGIPYVVEGYGIIYNEDIIDKYCGIDGAKIKSTEDINSFAKLKEVVEDMTSKKDKLGIEGVFSSTSFAPGEDWRWQTHLMNLPVYYEYTDDNVSDKEDLSFKYNENYKNIFDLYINNSCTAANLLGSKSVEDSMSEFALGKTAMVQNGNWGWGQVNSVKGNVVKEDKIKFLPIYTGVSGEEKQGLCIGTENFFSINKEASDEDKKASIDFVEWLFGDEEGKKLVSDKLGFISPFTTFTEAQNPSDPLAKEIIKYMDDSSKYTVSWNFVSFPSQTFKDDLGANLLQYASGKMKWDDVVKKTVDEWKAEKEATAE